MAHRGMGGATVRGLARRVAALLSTLAMATLPVLLVPGTAAAQGPPESAAGQSFGGCLKGQRAGDLLLLIDTSGSLQKSDKDKARVRAAKYLLTQMSKQAQSAGVTLDVQIAGFATNFDKQATPWAALDSSSVDGLNRTIDGFATEEGGEDTDYFNALEGARRSLADHAKSVAGESTAPRCQAMAWFTDGQLDIEPRNGDDPERPTILSYAPGVDLRNKAGADAATAAAATALCRPGGLADALRSAHVVTFAVGLTSADAPASNFDLMKSIATGAPYQGGPCGAITTPVPGSFALASDVDSLLRNFDSILGPPDVPTADTAVCAEADVACRGHEFVLDTSVDGVHVLGQAPGVPGVQAELIGPDGNKHALSTKNPGSGPQPLSFGAVTGSYSWETDASVVIDVSDQNPTANGWEGLWSLRFVDPAASTSNRTSSTSIHLWGNVLPTWANQAKTAPSGAPLKDVQLGLVKSGGGQVDPAGLQGTIAVSATLLVPGAASVPIATDLSKTTIADPLSIDLTSVRPGQATLQLILVLTTAPTTRPGTGEPVAGTRLSPQEVDLPLTIESPLGYPTPASTIDFGTTNEAGGQTAQLDITGSGCVWVAADAPLTLASTPEGVSRVGITAEGATTPQTCAAVAEGRHTAITLYMTADAAGTGTASGTLPVTIAPTGQLAKSRVVDVAFTGDFRKPVNVGNFLAALLAALLLGPGIPLALLYFLKWLNARIPDHGLYAQRISVTVRGTQVLRGGNRFELTDRDLTELVPIGPPGTRSVHVHGVHLRTRVGWSPFGMGFTSVDPGAGLACATSADPVPHGKRLTGRLPLAVHNTWAVLHDPSGDPEAADVLVLLSSDATADQRRAYAGKLVDELPAVLDRLRDATAAHGGPPSDHPEDGHGSQADPQYANQYGPPGGSGYPGTPYQYGPPSGGDAGGPSTTYGPPPPWERTESAPSTVPNRVPGNPSPAYERFYGPESTGSPGEDQPTDSIPRRSDGPPEQPPYGQRP